MITTAFDLDIDQQHREQQATIAEELFISGEGDGYDGIRPNRLEWAYLRGYAQGLRHKMAYIQEQAEQLESEGLALEAKVQEVFGEEIPF